MQVYIWQVKRKQTRLRTLATDIILNWLGTYPVVTQHEAWHATNETNYILFLNDKFALYKYNISNTTFVEYNMKLVFMSSAHSFLLPR